MHSYDDSHSYLARSRTPVLSTASRHLPSISLLAPSILEGYVGVWHLRRGWACHAEARLTPPMSEEGLSRALGDSWW